MDDPPPDGLAQRASRPRRERWVVDWEVVEGEGAAWGCEGGGIAVEGGEEVLVDRGGGVGWVGWGFPIKKRQLVITMHNPAMIDHVFLKGFTVGR